MFGKKQHGDFKKSYQKFLDPKKDTVIRSKHLRVLLDNYSVSEAKHFFEVNYSSIYSIVFEGFITLESELKRPNKSHREELDGILFLFEKILVLLPELIHKRWQFHSICTILSKLLYHSNSLKLRLEGMRLFLIWYQILQENATKKCHQMFASLVPGISQQKEIGTSEDHSKNHVSSMKVGPTGFSTILPPNPGEELPEDVKKSLLESLVLFMVSEITKVEWESNQMQEFSFNFLFNYFKDNYLMKIFPVFSYRRSSYDLDLTSPNDYVEEETFRRTDDLGEYQEVIIRWLTPYTHSSTQNENHARSMHDSPPEEMDCDAIPCVDQNISGIMLSTSSFQYNEGNSVKEKTIPTYEIVRSTLFSTRENINLVQELYRQAFYFQFKHTNAIRKVIAVYRDWFQSDELPMFMRGSTIPEHEAVTNAEGQLCRVGSTIRSGNQVILQAFITHSAHVFLNDPTVSFINDQVDMCKRVLNIYRHVVMNLQMERKTWEQLLLVLLKITSHVLKDSPPADRHGSLGGRLASALFQTLIVTWIKANLNVFISDELWDKFLSVLSSLTQWGELIEEWAKTMDTLTRLLARNVYNLDLNDLPLDRLSEQKEKRRRAKTSIGVSNNLKCSSSKIVHNDVITRSPNTSRRVEHRQTIHILSRNDSINENEGLLRTSLECHQRETNGIRTRSFSGSKIDLPSPSFPNASLKRCSSDSHLNQYNNAPTFDEENVVNSSMTCCEEIELDAAPFSYQFVDILGDHPSTEYQDKSSMTETINSVNGMQSATSVDSNLDNMCVLEANQTDAISETANRNDQVPETVLLSRDMLYPLRAELSSREESRRSSSPVRGSSAQQSLIGVMLDLSSGENSLTSDRESVHTDAAAEEQGGMKGPEYILESDGERCSLLAGGTVPGWAPDVCVVLWRRILGALGDVNALVDPNIHATVYKYLCDLLETLLKIQDNLGVTVDNASSPAIPELLPPIMLFAPWLFKALMLPDDYKRGKLLAYHLLCLMTIRRHDVMTPYDQAISDVSILSDHVAQFYAAVHDGLATRDENVVNALLCHCGPFFFPTGPSGNTLLIMDMVEAANIALNMSELQLTARMEAVSILGALVCYPCLYSSLVVLQPSTEELIHMSSAEVKGHLITSLLNSGKNEPVIPARCIALGSLGIYLYHELKEKTMHSKMSEVISTLTMTLRFNNKLVAQVACDVLYLLCDHIHVILEKMPGVPTKIIQSISATISSSLSVRKVGTDNEVERLACSLMFCLLEWTMRVPVHLMVDSEPGHHPLIHTVLKVLNQAVSDCALDNISQSTVTLSDLVRVDSDLESTKESQSCPASPWSEQDVHLALDLTDQLETTSTADTIQAVKAAAGTVLSHLVNHFGHFPRGGGAARCNSSVQEFHDIPELMMDELQSDIFNLPNLQFFVFNDTVLMSLIELPACRDVACERMAADLSTGNTITRLIIRDCTGKYCWDSAVLYRPPYNNPPSDLQDYVADCLDEDDELSISDRIADSFSFLRDMQLDDLDKLLNYIGTTSKECLLRRSEPLNVPSPLTDDIPAVDESDMCQCVILQDQQEQEYSHRQSFEGKLSKEVIPEVIEDPSSDFYVSRILLSQLGFLSSEKRATFDLLKKSERLLRELKNIDSHYCRETHKVAVFYVAVGQEDKNSILSNACGSKAYEDFVSGLGWEVDLETHCGYRGGLPNDKSCGGSALYYATSTVEIVFHCSSRMPGTTEEEKHRKLRHLGNDEVMIIWSEHFRDFRRGIIPTEFGDILIIIYPLDNGLYRVQVHRKAEIPYFGPLFDGAIVEETILPGLVRATALNAGRMKRSTIHYYCPFYEERVRYLSTIVSQHKRDSMFEKFTAEVFAPVIDPECTLRVTSLHDTPFMQESAGGGIFDGIDGSRSESASQSEYQR